MKKTIYIFLIYVTGLLLYCTTAKQSYKQGDYYTSVIQSVEKLRKNPNHKKSTEVLAQSYPMAVEYLTSQIQQIKSQNGPIKNSQLVDIYRLLNTMYDEIKRCPGALQVIPSPQDFHTEMSRYKQLAASEQYTAGETLLKTGNREDAKRAYRFFLKSRDYFPGYSNVEDKIREALYLATLKVRVEQLHPPTVQYELSIQFFQDQIEQFLFNYYENPFVRFYSADDPSLKTPDQILIFQFDDFKVGQTNNYQKTYELKKDSVVVGKAKMENGKTVDVYGTAKAKYIENKREVISEGLLSMKIIDAYSNTVVLHEKFPGRFLWSTMWGSFNGNEKALNSEQLKIANMQPLPPPPPQNLFIEFCKPIYGQVTNKIKAYYRSI
jgi:hypothetical protein